MYVSICYLDVRLCTGFMPFGLCKCVYIYLVYRPFGYFHKCLLFPIAYISPFAYVVCIHTYITYNIHAFLHSHPLCVIWARACMCLSTQFLLLFILLLSFYSSAHSQINGHWLDGFFSSSLCLSHFALRMAGHWIWSSPRTSNRRHNYISLPDGPTILPPPIRNVIHVSKRNHWKKTTTTSEIPNFQAVPLANIRVCCHIYTSLEFVSMNRCIVWAPFHTPLYIIV